MSVAEALTAAEVRALEAGFEPLRGRPLALAVSGGPDSMALLHLAASDRFLPRELDRATVIPPAGEGPPVPSPGSSALQRPQPAWFEGQNGVPPLVVLTVDHRLRPGSDGEAQMVAAEAGRLGLVHHTLAWEGPKPATGIAAAAREARYRLIHTLLEDEAKAYAERGIRHVFAGAKRVLVTAHHQDDQAETVVMRLARGSGIDGLAAMAPLTRWWPADASPVGQVRALEIARPLLAVAKSVLLRVVDRGSIPYVLDPTNDDDRHERVRVRRALAELEMVGVTPAVIAASARRLARARGGLAGPFEDLLKRIAWNDGFEAVVSGMFDAPDEIALRVLMEVVSRMGGLAGPPSLAQAETLLADLRMHEQRRTPFRATLAGATVGLDCRFEPARLGVVREVGRAAAPDLVLEPGQRGVWDRRYLVEVSGAVTHPVAVRPLGDDHFRRLAASVPVLDSVPGLAGAAATTPALFRGGTLVAVPVYSGLGRGIGAAFERTSGLAPGLGTARFILPGSDADRPRGSWWPSG